MDLSYDYLVVFEPTFVDRIVTQTFSMRNSTGSCHNYVIEQHPQVNATLNPFSLNKYGDKVARNKSLDITITYNPQVCEQKHVNYFRIKDDEKNVTVLCVKGESKGPLVMASVKNLFFYRISNDKKTKNIFELTNYSEFPIKYQFDIDNNQQLFQVEPTNGEVLPKSHTYVKVRFQSDQAGIYLNELVCLVLYHKPIFIELLGVNAKNEEKTFLTKVKKIYTPFTSLDCYKKYTDDFFGEFNEEPACNLSKICLEFGSKNAQNFHQVLSTNFTNNTDKCMKIKWDIETEKIFSISPAKKCLRPGEWFRVDCQFSPETPDQFYSSILYGRAFLYENIKEEIGRFEEPFGIPIPIALRVLGNSFPVNNVWFPQIEIHPITIHMPMCSTQEIVYNSFLIKRYGHLPVAFRFIAPDKTNFTLTPMQGLITENFQIIVVKFKPQYNFNKIYLENWTVELNEFKQNVVQIHLKASVEAPKILVGKENMIKFGNIFPGCKEYLDIPIQNLTQLSLRYKFYNNKYVSVENGGGAGNLESYEKVTLRFCYTAADFVPDTFTLTYTLIVLHSGLVEIGTDLECTVTIYAKSSYAKLCSTPTFHNFKDIVCGTMQEVYFNIFNFGECEMNFLLQHVEHFCRSDEQPFMLEPDKGTLLPNESIQIKVSLTSWIGGHRSYCVHYYVRESRYSDQIVTSGNKCWKSCGVMFRTEYFSFYPTLKIVDIYQNTTGPLFSKVNIWEFFEIESLNTILRTIMANETKRVDCRVPDAEAGLNISKHIKFIIKNVSFVDTTCHLWRKKNCDCELKEIRDYLSVRKYTYEDCPHRKLLELTITDETIRANSVQYLTVDVNYDMVDLQIACFVMQLSHNRNIEINFHIMGLTPGRTVLSTYCSDLVFKMYNVYIGELNPDIQVFWFFNNTRFTYPYKVYTKELRRLKRRYGTDILTCLNPVGEISPKRSKGILFKFTPIQVKKIRVTVPLVFDTKRHYLEISGEGSLFYTPPILHLAGYGPSSKDFYYHPGLLVNLSHEQLILASIPTYSSTTRLIFLRNVTTEIQLAYWFDSYYTADLMEVRVDPSVGMLKPKEFVSLRVTIKTYSRACEARVCLTCYLLNQSQLKQHIRTKLDFHQAAVSLHQEFTINENKTTYPTPELEITPQPKIFHRTLSVSVCIVSNVDVDLKVPIKQQLQQHPARQVSIYMDETLDRIIPTETRSKRKSSRPTEVSINTPVISGVFPDLSNQRLHQLSQLWPNPKSQPSCPTFCCLPTNDEQYALIRTVFECLLHDIVHSEKFRYYIYLMQQLPDKYYSEVSFTNGTGGEDKRWLGQLILNQMPNKLLGDVMTYLLQECVLRHFEMGAAHLPSPDEEDLQRQKRHSTTRDMYPEKFLFLLDDI